MPAHAADATASGKPTRWPNYYEGDFVIRNYVFRSGETLPELKLHYRTLGTAKRNAAGRIVNGVLLLQGNTGTGANWLRPSLQKNWCTYKTVSPQQCSGESPPGILWRCEPVFN
jgi:homoserine acetyltransferase